MNLQRYLIRFSYIGTNLSGLAANYRGWRTDTGSVQGLIEEGLRHMQPRAMPETFTSSRTDAGVHALDNTLHVDLAPRHDDSSYEPAAITDHLNWFFTKADVSVRVNSTQRVSNEFHARHCASGRHYVYRLVVPEARGAPMPVQEWGRGYFTPTLQLEAVEDACHQFSRHGDFAAFCKPKKDQDSTVRDLRVTYSQCDPVSESAADPAYRHVTVCNLHFYSRGFLYNQVRRVVGAVVGRGTGQVSRSRVEAAFSAPAHDGYPSGCVNAPPHGLYLSRVEYPPATLHPAYRTNTRHLPAHSMPRHTAAHNVRLMLAQAVTDAAGYELQPYGVRTPPSEEQLRVQGRVSILKKGEFESLEKQEKLLLDNLNSDEDNVKENFENEISNQQEVSKSIGDLVLSDQEKVLKKLRGSGGDLLDDAEGEVDVENVENISTKNTAEKTEETLLDAWAKAMAYEEAIRDDVTVIDFRDKQKATLLELFELTAKRAEIDEKTDEVLRRLDELNPMNVNTYDDEAIEKLVEEMEKRAVYRRQKLLVEAIWSKRKQSYRKLKAMKNKAKSK